MKKRLLSLLLALVMLLGLLPTGVLAAEPGIVTEPSAADEVQGSVLQATALPMGPAIDSSIVSQWPNFRGNAENMAIVNAKTPKDVDNTELKWAKQLGSGLSASPKPQIIVDNCLVVMCGQKIHKLNLQTGEVEATGEMSVAPSWGAIPPSYAEGLIFCPLGGGVVEAFSAKTLQKVWTYTSTAETATKWQAQAPITYANGKIYTGFWSGETGNADFVCLNAQTGAQEWSYSVKGGFYWAGSVAIGDYIAVGTDDGTSGSKGDSRLLVFKKSYVAGETVTPVSEVTLTGCGDQRSSLAYADGKVYFTTSGGYLCSAAINAVSGEISDLKTVAFGADKKSTSTPVVYGNYVYFGTGKGFSEGFFTIAERDTLSVVKEVKMIGYPQSSPLLSTAYLQEDGNLYFYCTYNLNPGGISLIRVEPDKPETATLTELYDAAGFQQYCTASIICDANGTLYYENDSGNVFAVGRKSSPEVTIAAYDYNAGAAKLAGASETGVIFRETVPFTEGLTPAEAICQAATQANIAIVGADEGYVESINGLAAGTGGGYSGWCLRYNNDDFANGGLHSIALKAGDVLEFHYSVNPDKQTDDVGHGWYGKPIFTSLTLAGRTVEMGKQTEFAGDGTAMPTYYIRDGQGIPVKMQGSGTEAEPFRIPISLPAGTNLTKLEAQYTTQLGAQYRQITGLEGKQDFSGEHSVTLSTQGGNKTYYLVQATAEPGSGGETPKPEDTILVTFRLIGATKSTEDVDVGAGKGDAQYQNWLQTETYVLNKGATVYDLFTMALDQAGLRYSATDSGYLDTIWAPEVYGGYALSEFTNGPRSGWMYLYNDTHPSVGMNGQTLKNGDRVVWHYVNDYAYEIGDWTGESNYPSLGDASTWVDWNRVVPDVRPTAGGSGAAKVDPADQKAADYVTGLISAIGSVTKDSGKKIQEARTAYDRLTDAQKALVSNYGKLTAAEKAYAALTGELPFTDVASNHWALPAIRYVYSHAWMSGVSATQFAPETTLNRGMLVTVLYRMAGQPSSKESDFADVPAGQWYSDAVAWAAKHNIVSGYGDGRFGPEDTITREQMAVILYRFAVEQGLDVSRKGTLQEFTDYQKISPWALDAMAWAKGAGLISGRTAEQIAPGESATRAETAAILMRFCAFAGK